MKIFLIVFIFVSSVCGQEENCDTLGGECISIHDCNVFKPYIKKSPSTRELVKQYHCGFDGNVPKVCCQPEHCTTLELMSKTCSDVSKDYLETDKCKELGGECISISDCDVLKSLIHKSTNDRNTVIKYHCGFDENIPRVCCPLPELNKCPTLEGTLGTCVSLRTCPHLMARRNSGRKEDIEYVQRSRCAGPEHYSVCCDVMQDVQTDPTSLLPNTYTENRYSTECITLNQTLGLISLDENSNNNTQCCGIEASSGNKIIGGIETAIDEYPWLAMLEYERPYLCGGTLISSLYVLTAAHCLVGDNMKPRGVKAVRLGEYNTTNEGRDCVEVEGDGKDCTDGEITITIKKIIVHPDYQIGDIVQANDIGLLKLSKAAPYTDFIRPICLPSSDVIKVALSSDLRFHVAGWGQVSEQRQRSAVKLQVDLPVVDQKTCEKLYSLKGNPIIWDKQFCAGGEPNKDTCKGDSGGPLIYSDNDSKTHQIVGITSFGILKCGSQGRPSIYTKVIDYVPWIVASTKDSKSDCKTPKGEEGTCIPLMDCQPLLNLVRKKDRTTEELQMLRNSQCGVSGKTIKVCCEINDFRCYNPDGNLGLCVGVSECPAITNMLQSSTLRENLNFIQNSRCESPAKYSVCCGSDHVSNVTASRACKPSSAPPDPRTECCGLDSSIGNKILGGTAAAIDQYPWLTLIEYRDNTDNEIKLLCGGSLINSKYVLTAGHCVVGQILNIGTPENIRLGEYDTSSSGRDCIMASGGGEDCTEDLLIIPIQKVIPHREYDPESPLRRNDIALIRMTNNSPYTDFIRPICLPTSDITQSNQNLTLYAAGWGAVSITESSSNIKLHVDLPYKPLEQCQKAYNVSGRKVKLWNGQLCAGGKAGKDTCRGDSGGPLMYDNGRTYSVVGVVNFGPTPCGLNDVPGVYTKVYEFLPWIRSNIKP